MAVLRIISQLSFLIFLIGAYLTAAMPTGNEVATGNQHLQQLQGAVNLTRNAFNARENDTNLLCKLVVLHKFSKRVNESLVRSTTAHNYSSFVAQLYTHM